MKKITKSDCIKIIKKVFNINNYNKDTFRVSFNKDFIIVMQMKTDHDMEFWKEAKTITSYLLKFDINKVIEEPAGYLHFEKSHHTNNQIWLSNVRADVTGYGIGAYCLKFMEEIAFQKGHTSISGDYRSSENSAYKMYTQNGYSICFSENTPEVYKSISEKTNAEICRNTQVIDGIKVYKDFSFWKKLEPNVILSKNQKIQNTVKAKAKQQYGVFSESDTKIM